MNWSHLDMKEQMGRIQMDLIDYSINHYSISSPHPLFLARSLSFSLSPLSFPSLSLSLSLFLSLSPSLYLSFSLSHTLSLPP